MLKPSQIVFVGGSHLENCIAMTRRAGYRGDIHVVNPRREEIAGISCHRSIEDLPDPPDASFIALSSERTINAVRSLAAVGAGGVICHAAGFGELGGVYRDLQDDLISAAGELALIGPNTMGLVNAFDNVALWGSDGNFQAVEDAGVAFITQSGAFLFSIINTEKAFPLGYGISLGNQACIDTADALDAVLDDERVKAVGLYAEGLTDGVALDAALAKAMQQGVPVVLLAGGGVPEAAQRSISHTGNLAVPRDFWRALADRHGVIEVPSLKQLIETTKLIAIGGLPKGPRIFFATHSGGAGALIAEQAPELGLELPPISKPNHDSIRPTLPKEVSIANPLDMNLPWRSETGVSLEDPGSIAQCLLDASRGDADAIAMMIDVPHGDPSLRKPWLPSLDAMIEVRRRTGLPTVAAGLVPDGIEPELRSYLHEGGVAALMGLPETVRALAGAAQFSAAQQFLSDNPPALLLAPGVPDKPNVLDEWESKQHLARYGLVFPERWAGRVEDASEAAIRVGFPVAVKVLDAGIAHKSKIGGVRLGLESPADVEVAIQQIRSDIKAAKPGNTVDRVLVEAMVQHPKTELILGVKRHETLGLALLIGRGGVDAEAYHDHVLTLLPASDRVLAEAIGRLRIPALSTSAGDAVLRAMRSVTEFAVDHATALMELDINPLLVTEDGEAVAVDALLVLSEDLGGSLDIGR